MRNYRWFPALIGAFVLGGCASTAQMHSVDADAPGLRASVAPEISGETNTIDIESAREPISTVAVDMPDMQMPAKRYVLRSSGAGLYEASNVDFAMAGTWRVSVLDAQGKRISSFTIAVR